MRMTRVRDFVATVFVLLLVLLFVAFIFKALGKPIPFIG